MGYITELLWSRSIYPFILVQQLGRDTRRWVFLAASAPWRSSGPSPEVFNEVDDGGRKKNPCSKTSIYVFLLLRPSFVGCPLAQLRATSSGFEDCVVPCGDDNAGEEDEEVRITSYKRLRKKWKWNVNFVTSQEMVKVGESGKVWMRITQHPQLYLFHEKNDSYQSLKELVVVPFNHFQISEWKIISQAKRWGMSVLLSIIQF